MVRRSLVTAVIAVGALVSFAGPDIRSGHSASPVDKTAVRELETYLMRRAGRGGLSVDGVRDVVFHVGDTEFARRHGLDASAMAEESWRIKSFGGSVVLVGGGVRGTLYAVYHFLEDFCGVRWWSETEEDVPKGPLALPRLDASGQPAFPYRDDYRSEFAREATPQFAVRRRLNRNGDVDIPLPLGGSFAFGPPYYCHTFNKYINWESLGKTRPELFSLVDGKRCGGQDYDEGGQLCLSNPEVYSVIRDGLVGYATNSVAEARERGLSCPVAFEVSMNDNRRYCQCEGCKAQMAEGGVTAQYLDFVNRLAADLRRVRPEAAVSTLAYYFTEEPPSNSVRAAGNVIIKLCNTRSNLAAPFYEPGDNDIMRDLIGKWEKISKHLFVWDYDQTFTAATFGLPFPSEFHFADKFRFYREHHVDGIFWQQTMGPDEDIPELKFYLKSKLFEDPYVDYPKLLERSFSEYFGPKAGPLVLSARRRMVEAQARNRGRLLWFPQFNQWNFIRAEDLTFMNAKWDAAEKAVAHEPVFLRRVTRARSGLRRLTERRTGVMVRNLKGRPSWEFPPEKYVLNGKTNTVLVADAAAPGGKAVELSAGATDVDSLLVAYYDADEKAKGGKAWSFSARLKAGEASLDYRWFALGTATLAENGYFYLTDGWLVHIQLPTPDFADKSYEVRVLARKTKEGKLRIARFELVDCPVSNVGKIQENTIRKESSR